MAAVCKDTAVPFCRVSRAAIPSAFGSGLKKETLEDKTLSPCKKRPGMQKWSKVSMITRIL